MAERDDEDLRQKFRRARKAHLRMGARMALIGLGGFGGFSGEDTEFNVVNGGETVTNGGETVVHTSE